MSMINCRLHACSHVLVQISLSGERPVVFLFSNQTLGGASVTVPVYIAETAPSDTRGQMVTINNMFITGGQFVAAFVDGTLSPYKRIGWRYVCLYKILYVKYLQLLQIIVNNMYISLHFFILLV